MFDEYIQKHIDLTIRRNVTNDFLRISGILAREGVQPYKGSEIPGWTGDPNETIGVYRGRDVLVELCEGLKSAGVILLHKKLNSTNSQEIMGVVADCHVAEIEGVSVIKGDVILWNSNAIDEIVTQLVDTNKVILPVSPSYHPRYGFKSGEWIDSLGLLTEPNSKVAYKATQEPTGSGTITVNHLAIVDFGRGGEIAALFGARDIIDDSLTTDTLYNYPQVTLNAKKKKKNMKDTMKDGQKDGAKDTGSYNDAVLDTLKAVSDGQKMIIDALTGVSDAMKEMKPEKAGMSQETGDAILNQLGSLSEAIASAYTNEEGAAHRENAMRESKATAKAGKEKNFIFDGLGDILKGLAESQKAMSDAMTVVVENSNKDNSYASVTQSAASNAAPGTSTSDTITT